MLDYHRIGPIHQNWLFLLKESIIIMLLHKDWVHYDWWRQISFLQAKPPYSYPIHSTILYFNSFYFVHPKININNIQVVSIFFYSLPHHPLLSNPCPPKILLAMLSYLSLVLIWKDLLSYSIHQMDQIQ